MPSAACSAPDARPQRRSVLSGGLPCVEAGEAGVARRDPGHGQFGDAGQVGQRQFHLAGETGCRGSSSRRRGRGSDGAVPAGAPDRRSEPVAIRGAWSGRTASPVGGGDASAALARRQRAQIGAEHAMRRPARVPVELQNGWSGLPEMKVEISDMPRASWMSVPVARATLAERGGAPRPPKAHGRRGIHRRAAGGGRRGGGREIWRWRQQQRHGVLRRHLRIMRWRPGPWSRGRCPWYRSVEAPAWSRSARSALPNPHASSPRAGWPGARGARHGGARGKAGGRRRHSLAFGSPMCQPQGRPPPRGQVGGLYGSCPARPRRRPPWRGADEGGHPGDLRPRQQRRGGDGDHPGGDGAEVKHG